MAKPILTVDIDDVVADSTEAFRLAVNKHTGANLTAEDYRVPHIAYDRYYEHVWQSHDLHVKYDEVSVPMQIDQAHVPLIKGVEEALAALMQRFTIVFITARPVSWQDATEVYIQSKLKHLNADVHFSESRNGISKGQICRELGASWHIDDNPDHCQSVIDKGIQAILFGDYGWHYKEVKGVVKCKDWGAVREYFDKHEGLTTNSE